MINKKEIEYIGEVREMVENLGESCPIYVSFDKDNYSLDKQQMYAITKALYLADIALSNNK